MPYDRSLDECLFTKSTETETAKLSASIHAYNGGTKKLQLTRENKDDVGGLKFAKLGRMTKEEITALLPLIQEASGQM